MRIANRAWAGLVAAVVLSVLLPLEPSSPVAVADESCAGQPCTWNFGQIKVPAAQPLGSRGEGVTVAIVDSWVDQSHPELRDRVIGHAYCVGTGGQCRANTRSVDECTHGTHVAGTVASTNYGVAPKARLLAVQVLSEDGDDCSGSAKDAAAGIRFAASQRASVINLSLGGLVPGLFQSEAVSSAVRDAARAGAVVVFAAGNTTIPVSDDYGSAAMLVAATGPNGGLASYSSRGGAIDLAAPGGDAGLAPCERSTCILSTVPHGAYALHEGTSMAAPHVSGVAALLLAQNPQRGRADVVSTLRETARSLSGVRNGLVDAEAALKLHVRPSSPAPTGAGGPDGSAEGRTGSGRDDATRRPQATSPRSTWSARVIPGTGPYAKDLGNGAGTTLPKFTEPGLPETDGDREAPPLADQHPKTDTPSRFPLPMAVGFVALVGLGAWAVLTLSARRSRTRSTDWPAE